MVFLMGCEDERELELLRMLEVVCTICMWTLWSSLDSVESSCWLHHGDLLIMNGRWTGSG